MVGVLQRVAAVLDTCYTAASSNVGSWTSKSFLVCAFAWLLLTCCCWRVLQRVATEISVLQSIKHPLLPTLHQVYTTGDEIFMEMTVSLNG
jgi:hypothetical protein